MQLRWCSKLLVLRPAATTLALQHVQRIVVWSTSGFLKPKNFQTTNTAPLFCTSSTVSCSTRSGPSISELLLFLSIPPLNTQLFPDKVVHVGVRKSSELGKFWPNLDFPIRTAKESPVKWCSAAQGYVPPRSYSPVLRYKNSYKEKQTPVFGMNW